jgi:hypothetical protein
MDETKLRTIAQLQEFLDATSEVKFTLAAGVGDAERYEHISRVLKRFEYRQCGKHDRGVVLAYLCAFYFRATLWPTGRCTDRIPEFGRRGLWPTRGGRA